MCKKDEETINKRDKRRNTRVEVSEYSYFSLSYNNFQRFPDLVPVPISAPDLHIVYASTWSQWSTVSSRMYTEHNLDRAYIIIVACLVYQVTMESQRAHNPFVGIGWGCRRVLDNTFTVKARIDTYRKMSVVTTSLWTFFLVLGTFFSFACSDCINQLGLFVFIIYRIKFTEMCKNILG